MSHLLFPLLEYFRSPSALLQALNVLESVHSDEEMGNGGFQHLDPPHHLSHRLNLLLDHLPDRLSIRSAADLPQAIEDLRSEKYVSARRRDRLLRLIYYLLRPLLIPPFRLMIHRNVFRSRQAKFPQWPVDCSVDEIHKLLLELMLRASGKSEVPFIWFWPDGYSSALMMTHDVEERRGAEHCNVVMDLDESFELPAAFQIVPERRYEGVVDLIQEIRSRGFEVNLHDLDHDGRLYEDESRFKSRANKINDYAKELGIRGFRAGSMHRNQKWYSFLKVEYDMSVPNVANLEPQSGGCCTVMPYFVGKILELPLTTVQDHSLFYILQQNSTDLWKQQIETILRYHGLISFIVHPDYVVRERERRVYRELLQEIVELKQKRGVWLTLPGEINRWWRLRRAMTLSPTPTGWKIQGEGNARARLAYARIVDDELTFWVGDRNMTSIASSDIIARSLFVGKGEPYHAL